MSQHIDNTMQQLERELVATRSELSGIKRTLGKVICNLYVKILTNKWMSVKFFILYMFLILYEYYFYMNIYIIEYC